ncbi:PR domain zinc finger protein 5-like [Diabrotica virgifera virgifera]|uniref:PR domain zinc finger protein 5-like n=1 Tax=Diabrotica virgifera virgifera TaxID=50390 RepID=A0A6P7FQL1_DIAVI|nr:PR domain zinc finger protein 5-like [Diabrotica virgifera virgifera]
MSIASGVRDNKCAKCGTSFANSYINIQEHIEAKHYFQCKYCFKSFITVKEIESHDKTAHLKIKCPHCAEYCKSKKQLQRHIEAKHCIKCSFCDETFISIEDVTFHDRYTHLIVECQYCDSYFRSDKGLDQHIKVQHCFPCPGCSETFKSVEIRNFHDKNVHLTVECPHCDILFRKDEDLQQHIEDQHKFVCRWCKKPFKSSEEENFHQECIHVTFDCSYCTLYFSTDKQLKEHSEKHNLNKPKYRY